MMEEKGIHKECFIGGVRKEIWKRKGMKLEAA